MRRWSEVAERIAATTRTSEKTRLLAGYLREVEPDGLAPAVVFFTGRAFAEADARPLGLGWAAISDTVGRAAGVDQAEIAAAYDRFSDLGRAVGQVLALHGVVPQEGVRLGVADIAEAFAGIETAQGPAAKSSAFEALLARCDPLEATYVVKILAGELRIGLRDGLLEAALAAAFDRPAAAVSRAAMLTGDIGATAELARDDHLDDARVRLFRPVRFMLASPAEDAAAIVARLGATVWTEDKYDGIRAQLHRQGDVARLYSRDLHDVSGQFPEIVEAALTLAWDGILDGEVLGFRDSTVLPFLSLQQRLGRRNPSARILAEVPAAFVAFDVIALGPRGGVVEPMLERPLRDRRAHLEAIGLPDADPARFALSLLVTAEGEAALERVFAAARARRNEGLMVKDPDSVYSPGRRGYGWLKMKKALATLDCVVVGVEVGHGKRHGVLSDYTFAVRDGDGGLVTIGKAYTGLTDAEIAEMTAWFEAHTISRAGRYRVVEPSVVVEVAFDVIMRSGRHQSGFALRFPRIARLRPDKAAHDADTLATVERLWAELQPGATQLVTMGAGRSVPPRARTT